MRSPQNSKVQPMTTTTTTTPKSPPSKQTGTTPSPHPQTPTNSPRDLYTLGRWDVGANVFANVAKYTGDRIRKWSTTPDLAHRYFNSSYAGIFNSHGLWAPQPVPDCHSRRNGRTTLPAIKAQWESQQEKNYYHGELEVPDGLNPPVIPYSF